MSQRRFVVALLISLVILLAVSFGENFTLFHKVNAATTNFTLYAYLSGWNSSKPSGPNPTITVTQGDTISFTLIGGDSLTHLFLLDIDNSSITTDCPNPGPDKCSGNITPTYGSSVAPFTISAAPGTYFYYCTYHSPMYMVGKFVIRTSTTPDFTIAANPTTIGPLNTRVAGTSAITVAPANGFTGAVTLTASPSSGLNATVFPTTISGGSGSATLAVNSTTAGSYSVTVTGTGSPGTHSTTITVTVVMPDFKIALSSSTLTVAPGASGNVMVTLTSLNGFSGTVSLTSALSSSGPQVTFNPASLAVPSSASVSSTLSVSAASSGAYSTPVSQGSYMVTVTGTSGSLVHSATLALTVGSSAGVGALPSAAIIGGGIAVAIAVVAATVYFLRRRPKMKT
jgi:plastocyanin